MNRLAIGAALGGLAVYLYDPEHGENRRERLSSLWQENRAGVLRAGHAAADTIESGRPLARRITKAVDRRDWAVALDRGRSGAGLSRIVGAAALGGALVYFMDPAKGSARRISALDAGRQAARQVADMVKPVQARVGDRIAGAADRVRVKVG